MSKQSELKLLEAYTRDVGRGIVRIDYDTMDDLGLSTGNVVKVIGKRTTVGKVLPLYPSDEGKQILRTDKLIRDNSKSEIGSTIKIEKIEAVRCIGLEVKPLECIPPIDDRYVADALEGVGIVLGDKVVIPYFGGRLSFEVIKTEPEGFTIIDQRTNCKILDAEEEQKRLEIDEPFEAYRSKLVSDMKLAIREKNVEKINEVIMNIQKVDFLHGSIKNILSDKSNAVTYSYDDSLIPVLKEVFNNEQQNPNEVEQ